MNALAVSCITIITLACNCLLLIFFLIPQIIIVSGDWFIAPSVLQQLKKTPLPKKLQRLEKYTDNIIDSMPVFQTVETRLRPYKRIHIRTHARMPWILINKHQVLTTDGFVLATRFFKNEILEGLSHIIVKKELSEGYNAELFEFMQKVPKNILL